MAEEWDKLAMAQAEVIRAAHDCILWNSCGFGTKGKNYEAERWIKLLMKVVGERDLALQALLDAMMEGKKPKGDRSLMKVIRRGRGVAIRKTNRRAKVQKQQCGWQVSLCVCVGGGEQSACCVVCDMSRMVLKPVLPMYRISYCT